MDLTGKLILAMPGMGDTRFQRAVILICAHTAEGAMGIMINKPLVDFSFSDLLTQLKIQRGERERDIRVHFGGPVERGRGFVLHSPDYFGGQTSTTMAGTYRMTGTLDVLEALAQGTGPSQAILALGYSGWGPGQLETEIRRNDWLTGEPSDTLIFGQGDPCKWGNALQSMGIDPVSLSGTAGRA